MNTSKPEMPRLPIHIKREPVKHMRPAPAPAGCSGYPSHGCPT